MKIILPISDIYKETDIILCNLTCLDKKGVVVCIVTEKVLYCKYRGFNEHYLKQIHKSIIKKISTIKIEPVKIIGTGAIKN